MKEIEQTIQQTHGLNYKFLPKQKLFHMLTSLNFGKFTSRLKKMTPSLLEEYLNLIAIIPYYVLFGGARG